MIINVTEMFYFSKVIELQTKHQEENLCAKTHSDS